MDLFALLETALAVQSKMLATDRAMQDATRAPRQARNKGWRPHGRLRSQPATPSKDCRFFVQKMGSTSLRGLVIVLGEYNVLLRDPVQRRIRPSTAAHTALSFPNRSSRVARF